MHIPTATIAVAATLTFAAAASVGERPQKPAPAAGERPLAVLWQRALPVGDSAHPPTLVVGDAQVIVARPDAGIAAYASTDGSPVWSAAIAPLVPPVLEGDILAVATPGALRAVALHTGEAVWRVDVEADPASLVGFRDRIGAVTGTELRLWDGAGVPAWRARLDAKPVTPFEFRNGTLYAGLDDSSLIAIDAATGAARWRTRLPAVPDSLAVADDRLYVGGSDGALYGFAAGGAAQPVWRYELVRSIGQPIAEGRLVYFTLLDNSMRALDGKGGSQRWSRVLPSRPFTGPFKVGSNLAVALTSGDVVELSLADGRLLTSKASQPPQARPAVVRLQAAAVSRDGARVYTVTIAKDYSSTLTAWGRPAER